MPGSPTGTRKEQITYYEQWIAKLTGTYQGNDVAFQGQTWVQIYEYLLAQFPSESPKDIGDKVVGLWATQQVGQGIATSGSELGPFSAAAQKAAAQTNFAGPFAGILGPFAGLTDALIELASGIGAFYDAVTDGKMWRSLGWLLLGAILLILGIMLWLKKENYLPSAVPVPI